MEERLELQSKETYSQIRNAVITPQSKVAVAVNTAMIHAYWEIGEQIYISCGENDRADYGKQLLKYLANELTNEFGKGFSERNLRRMRQFYLVFPIRLTLSSKLSWSRYMLLMQIDNNSRRQFYLEE